MLILSLSKSSYPYDPGCCRSGGELQGWERAARGWGEQNNAFLGNLSMEGVAQITWTKFHTHFSIEVTEVRLYLTCAHRIPGLPLKRTSPILQKFSPELHRTTALLLPLLHFWNWLSQKCKFALTSKQECMQLFHSFFHVLSPRYFL